MTGAVLVHRTASKRCSSACFYTKGPKSLLLTVIPAKPMDSRESGNPSAITCNSNGLHGVSLGPRLRGNDAVTVKTFGVPHYLIKRATGLWMLRLISGYSQPGRADRRPWLIGELEDILHRGFYRSLPDFPAMVAVDNTKLCIARLPLA
jgi:hypothetical protein